MTEQPQDPIYLANQIYTVCDNILKYSENDFVRSSSSTHSNDVLTFDREWEVIAHHLELVKHIKNLHQSDFKNIGSHALSTLHLNLERTLDILRRMRNFCENSHNSDSSSAYDLDSLTKEHDNLSSEFKTSQFHLQNSFAGISSTIMFIKQKNLEEQITRLTDKETNKGITKHYKLFDSHCLLHNIVSFFWLAAGFFFAFSTMEYGIHLVENSNNLIEEFLRDDKKLFRRTSLL